MSLDEVRKARSRCESSNAKYMNLNEKHEELAIHVRPRVARAQSASSAMDQSSSAPSTSASTRRRRRKSSVRREGLVPRSGRPREPPTRIARTPRSPRSGSRARVVRLRQVKAELDNQRQILQGLLRRRSETDITADLGERQPVRVKFIERAEVPRRVLAGSEPPVSFPSRSACRSRYRHRLRARSLGRLDSTPSKTSSATSRFPTSA